MASLKIILAVTLLLFPASVYAAAEPEFQCYGTEYAGNVEEFRVATLKNIKSGNFPGAFQHTGGGPNGSHWNFSGMREGLFCVVLLPANAGEIKSLKIRVGKIGVPVQMKPEDLSAISFSIPFDPVSKGARKIRRQDLSLLFSDKQEEIASYLKNGAWQAVAPPEIGMLVEITATIQTQNSRTYSLKRMIHASFGE